MLTQTTADQHRHEPELYGEEEPDPLDRHIWRKSTASGAGDDCVELAVTPGVTGIRDTKNRDLGRLVIPDASRAALVAFAVRAD